MRVYFLYDTPAALKLNGIYIGIIDSFERFVDMEEDNVLAEIIPDGDLEQINFFICNNFFLSPPPFADVYLMGGDRLIYIRRYAPKDNNIYVVRQTNFCGNKITLFTQGEPNVSLEGQTAYVYNLPSSFADATFKEEKIGGLPVLILQGSGCIAVISSSGKLVFINSADNYFCDDRLHISVNFGTCAQIKGECAFSYDGQSLCLAASKATETAEISDDIMPFAFFESVLTRADCGKYLCGDLSSQTYDLYSFLGNFVIPPQNFCLSHPDLPTVGLVYVLKDNLYNVRYFSVQIEGGKITNIIEAQ
jgi:hypothetical protein